MAITIRKNKRYYLSRFNELESEYTGNGWEVNHEQKTQYLYPHGRNIDDETEGSGGERKDEYILNNTALIAIRVLVSGLFTGTTPPFEKWFKLVSEDKELNEVAAVNEYFQKVTDKILTDMSKSNFYTVMDLVFNDLCTYSISNVQVDTHMDKVFNFTHVPNGQYYIDTDEDGKVNATYRKFKMRVRNVLSKYGEKNLPPEIIDMISQSRTGGGEFVDILHVQERNDGRDIDKIDNTNMEWASITYALVNDSDDSEPLMRSGYNTKPFAVPRWSVSSGNIYGNGPGDVAIGDVMQLQKLETLLLEAIEKEVNPPLKSYIGTDINTGPNELTIIDSTNPTSQKLVETLYDVQIDIQKLAALIITTQERIKSAFFSDLFFALSAMDKERQTATEIIAIQKEISRLLGPIIQRIKPELLQDIIERCFDIEERLGRLPEPPEEIRGSDIKIEILSMLSQAQELSIVTPIEQIMTFTANMAQFWPQALNKFDPYQAIDELNRVLSIPAGVIRPDEVVAEIESIQAEQALREQQAIQDQQDIESAKQLSETNIGGDNALGALLSGGVA